MLYTVLSKWTRLSSLNFCRPEKNFSSQLCPLRGQKKKNDVFFSNSFIYIFRTTESSEIDNFGEEKNDYDRHRNTIDRSRF